MQGQEVARVEEAQVPAEVKSQVPQSNVQQEIEKLIPLAGTIELSEEQKQTLFAPVDPEDVEIRPDGLVYLPWMEYVTRLRNAFGVSWTLLPKGSPIMKDDLMLWGFYLIIQGKPAGFAVGEQRYQQKNDTMSYGDCLEGAKSNALMRLCKGLGISLELWKPKFVKEWKSKYAESYPAKWPDGKPKLDKNGKQKTEWRKKGSPKVEEDEPESGEPSESEKLCSILHDEMMEFKTGEELATFWTNDLKAGSENRKILTPKHFDLLCKLKDELKKKLEGK